MSNNYRYPVTYRLRVILPCYKSFDLIQVFRKIYCLTETVNSNSWSVLNIFRNCRKCKRIVFTFFTEVSRIVLSQGQTFFKINQEFLNRFFCVLGAESCDAFDERIKLNMVDLLENQYSQCSLQMQAVGSRAIPYLKNKFPDLWKLLVDKYQEQENSTESYFMSAYDCLIEDLNCNLSLDLLKKALPDLLKLNFIPGEKEVTILLGHRLKLVEKKFPFVYRLLLDKFTAS